MHSKVIACTETQTDRQTHKQYENITLSHTREVKIQGLWCRYSYINGIG